MGKIIMRERKKNREMFISVEDFPINKYNRSLKLKQG